jgi:hypothetical protein
LFDVCWLVLSSSKNQLNSPFSAPCSSFFSHSLPANLGYQSGSWRRSGELCTCSSESMSMVDCVGGFPEVLGSESGLVSSSVCEFMVAGIWNVTKENWLNVEILFLHK